MAGDGAVLALDVGTSSCRASLYDLRGRALKDRFAHIVYAPTITPDGGAELDPEVLFHQLCAAIDQVLAHDPPRIVAVATDTYWHSLLGVDARGRPVTPIYLWLDARSRAEVARLRERVDVRAVHARVGTILHWSYWPAKLNWLRRTQPDLFRKVKRWISFGELVLERLTGERGVSVSMASGTGLLDIHRCTFDAEMLSLVGIDPDQLAEIKPLAHTATARSARLERWPALKGVPWLLAVGDGASSNIGAGCTTPDHFALMVGTSAAERVLWSPTEPFEVPWGAWCYRVDERRVIIGGALNDGGNLLSWLHGSLRLPALAPSEAAVDALEPDGHGLTVLPFWGGERSPGWADDARGALVGLRLHTQPVDILRACLEAVALRFGELDRILLSAMPHSREIVATGGALLHSPAWMQILADVLDRPVLA
ncbi:MAG: gluconokinase, partial [Chloroflexi bacterium]|nr:gluconokinase [Chloroflexota bacterium]